MALIPVTILTGFLGSGKTTLLNHILKSNHGQRIAVIENEFGETGVDNDLLVHDSDEQIVEMNNGCICCSVRGDLVRILSDLAVKRKAGRLRFDRVVIETTGLAHPSPVAQTFFVDETLTEHFLLDAVVTTIDCVHGPKQLDAQPEALEQVAFADRLLLTKTDLADAAVVSALRTRLATINARATIAVAHKGVAAVDDLLDIRGFNLNAILDVAPEFLEDSDHHHHTDDVTSFVFRDERPIDLIKFEDLLAALLPVYGHKMMRYKGILNGHGEDRRIIFQGVHMLMGVDLGAKWKGGEPRHSTMVFIGRDLPREILRGAFDLCLVPPRQTASLSSFAA